MVLHKQHQRPNKIIVIYHYFNPINEREWVDNYLEGDYQLNLLYKIMNVDNQQIL